MSVTRAAEPETGAASCPDELLDAVFAVTTDVLCVLDASGALMRWNRSAERVFGVPSGELEGCAILPFFPDHLRPEIEAAHRFVAAGERVDGFETEIVRSDGMPVPLSVTLVAVMSDGKTVATLLVGRDITEQRVNQAALAEAVAQVQASEALAHIGSWLWDRRTGSVQWSDEFHRLHGIDPLAFDGTFASHLAAIDERDRPGVRAALEEAVAGRGRFEREYRVVRPDGEVRTLHVLAHATIGSDGLAIGLRGIGRDITTN